MFLHGVELLAYRPLEDYFLSAVRDCLLGCIQQRAVLESVAYPGILFGRCSTNSVEDRGQRERGSAGQ